MTRYRILATMAVAALLTSLAACTNSPAPSGSALSGPSSTPVADKRLKVIATTTIVGDVVRQVGGDLIDLTVLLPAGADPHGFQPKPQDAARVAEASLVFINGLGLEGFLDRLLQSAGGSARIVAVSDGVPVIEGDGEHDDQEPEGAVHEEEAHDHQGADPHVWMDPNNVRIWTRNIAAALSEVDPANAAAYQANAQRYDQTLQALDAWTRDQIAQIAPEKRQMVVDHDTFSYFAQRYGFETVGAIVPGYSTMSATSAQELARLEDAIRNLGVSTIFVGKTINLALPDRIATDTGAQLVFLFTESLSESGDGGETYEDFVRYNVNAIVEALNTP